MGTRGLHRSFAQSSDLSSRRLWMKFIRVSASSSSTRDAVPSSSSSAFGRGPSCVYVEPKKPTRSSPRLIAIGSSGRSAKEYAISTAFASSS